MKREIGIFELGGTKLGVDILIVNEISRINALTSIPDAPKNLRGLLNLRGRVVTVIDLNECLNRPRQVSFDNCHLLILKTDEEIRRYKLEGWIDDNISLGDDIVGFIINQMDEVIEVESTDVFPPPQNLNIINRELISGVVKQGDSLVILLDITAILNRVMTVTADNDLQEKRSINHE